MSTRARTRCSGILGGLAMVLAGLMSGTVACGEEFGDCPPLPSLEPGEFGFGTRGEKPLFDGVEGGTIVATEERVWIEYERVDGTQGTVVYDVVERFPD